MIEIWIIVYTFITLIVCVLGIWDSIIYNNYRKRTDKIAEKLYESNKEIKDLKYEICNLKQQNDYLKKQNDYFIFKDTHKTVYVEEYTTLGGTRGFSFLYAKNGKINKKEIEIPFEKGCLIDYKLTKDSAKLIFKNQLGKYILTFCADNEKIFTFQEIEEIKENKPKRKRGRPRKNNGGAC